MKSSPAENVGFIMCISRCTYELSENELLSLCATAARNNARYDITGCLILLGNYFIQTFEGPPQDVSRLLRIVSDDKRHTDVVVLAQDRIENRVFAQWSMTCMDRNSIYCVDRASLIDIRTQIEDMLSDQYKLTQKIQNILGQLIKNVRKTRDDMAFA